MPDISQLSPEETAAFIENFVAVANAGTNLVRLGMTLDDTVLLADQRSAINFRKAAQLQAQDAAKAATVALNDAVKTAKANLSTRNRQITANPNVSNVIKQQLGLTIPDPNPTDATPVPPIGLAVTGTPDGVNTLRWKRGTNRPGVQYVIEAKVDGAASWRLIDAVTATRFDHTGQTPGLPVVYRVKARRRGILSGASNETTIYG